MGQTILLADDSITIQKVIELTFSDEDFTLHTVGNGQKAIEEIRSVRPDIVLCDIIMPEKNGYEVCEFIKSSDDLSHIPVLLLTGAFEPFDQERARKAGCDGFLAKPFEPQTLISKVRELLTAAAQAPTVQAPAAAKIAEPVPTPAMPEPIPPAAMEQPPTVELSTVAEPPPTPGMPSFEESSTVMADSFAVEAGERELTVEAGDQTFLLNEEESLTASSEDIWSEVQQTPPTPSAQPLAPFADAPDDASTVFMESEAEPFPSEPVPVEEVPDGAGFDDFAAMPVGPTNPTDSGTWILPSPDEEQVLLSEPSLLPGEPEPPTVEPTPPTPESRPQATEPLRQMSGPTQPPKEPELTPLGDFGGFDDFSAAESPGIPKLPDMPIAPLPQVPEPADLEVEDPTFFASADAFKMPPQEPPAVPAPPEPLAPTTPESPIPDMSLPQAPPSLSPEMPFSEPTAVEPEPPPAMAQFDEPFPMVEPTPFDEPSRIEAEPTPFVDEPMIEDPTPTPQTVRRANSTLEPGELIASQIPDSVEPTPLQPEPPELMSEPPDSREAGFEEAFVSSQADLPTGEPVEETAEPTLVTRAREQAAAVESAVGSDELDILAERVAEKVIARLSDKIIKDIAWEIVPDLAQTLIQKEIDELKAKIPE